MGKFRKFAIGAAAAAALLGTFAAPAVAADSTTYYGDIAAGINFNRSLDHDVGRGTFTDTYNFNLLGYDFLHLNLDSEFVRQFQVSLDGNLLTDTRPHVPGFQFTSAALTGVHSFMVTGRGLSRDAEYGGRFRLTATVPEPSSIALAMAGLGVLGVSLRRRRNR